MTARTLAVIVLALACGLLAAIGMLRMNDGGAAPVATVAVAFATIDLHRGQAIPDDAVEMRRIPAEFAPEAAVGKAEDAAGRIARLALMKGDPILETKLEPKGAKGRLVPPGMRAFNVIATYPRDLDEDSRVDVLFTTNVTGGPGPPTARAPIFNVPVWDLPESSGKGSSSNGGPVTLLVDPEQAEALNQG